MYQVRLNYYIVSSAVQVQNRTVFLNMKSQKMQSQMLCISAWKGCYYETNLQLELGFTVLERSATTGGSTSGFLSIVRFRLTQIYFTCISCHPKVVLKRCTLLKPDCWPDGEYRTHMVFAKDLYLGKQSTLVDICGFRIPKTQCCPETLNIFGN